jgi:hypothetical protein
MFDFPITQFSSVYAMKPDYMFLKSHLSKLGLTELRFLRLPLAVKLIFKIYFFISFKKDLVKEEVP